MKTFSFTKSASGLIKLTTDTPDGNKPPAQLFALTTIRSIAKNPSYGNKVIVDLVDTSYGDFVLDPAVDTITIGTTTYAPGDLTVDQLLDAIAASTVFQKANSGSGGSGMLWPDPNGDLWGIIGVTTEGALITEKQSIDPSAGTAMSWVDADDFRWRITGVATTGALITEKF